MGMGSHWTGCVSGRRGGAFSGGSLGRPIQSLSLSCRSSMYLIVAFSEANMPLIPALALSHVVPGVSMDPTKPGKPATATWDFWTLTVHFGAWRLGTGTREQPISPPQ